MEYKHKDVDNTPLQYCSLLGLHKGGYEQFCFVGYKARSPFKVDRCFGGTYYLHLQGRRISQARTKVEAGNEQNILHGVISTECRMLLLSYWSLYVWRQFPAWPAVHTQPWTLISKFLITPIGRHIHRVSPLNWASLQSAELCYVSLRSEEQCPTFDTVAPYVLSPVRYSDSGSRKLWRLVLSQSSWLLPLQIFNYILCL
jgi:hypothetical protein